MKIVNKLNQIFNNYKEDNAIVREITLIGETKDINKVYVVQQTTSEGVKNYCISATENEYDKIWHELANLKSSDVYLYLKSRLLIEPFIENDLEKTLELCKTNLPKISIRGYSIFME